MPSITHEKYGNFYGNFTNFEVSCLPILPSPATLLEAILVISGSHGESYYPSGYCAYRFIKYLKTHYASDATEAAT